MPKVECYWKSSKTNIFLYMVVTALCIGLVISINETFHLKSRLDTQSNLIFNLIKGDKETAQNLKYQQFKEDSYLRQQDKDTNLIMMYIPCVFLIITAFSYLNIREVIDGFRKYIVNKTDEYDKKHENFHEDLVNIQNSLNREIGFLRESEAQNYLNMNDFSDFVSMSLTAISYFSRCYSYYKKNKDEVQEKMISQNITESLMEIQKVIDKNIIEIDKSEVLNATKEIRENTNNDISLLLSKIETTLKLK